MSQLFKTLKLEAFRKGIAPRTEQSRTWFMDRVKEMRNINRSQLMNESEVEIRKRQVVGSMFMFFYQPKHRDTLDYYDSFPLVIVLGPAAGGFLGLNLHYLPPILRAKFLDALLEVTNNDRYDQTTKFKMTYEIMKKAAKYKYFKPCIHHYLNTHLASKFALIPAPSWEIAVFLPTADFHSKGKKFSITKVYQNSKDMINGHD